jgi:hypothetical protein
VVKVRDENTEAKGGLAPQRRKSQDQSPEKAAAAVQVRNRADTKAAEREVAAHIPPKSAILSWPTVTKKSSLLPQ